MRLDSCFVSRWGMIVENDGGGGGWLRAGGGGIVDKVSKKW